MESITRNVGELSASERTAFETAVGHPLVEGQQVILQVLDASKPSAAASAEETLDRLAIFADLSEEVALDLEAAILDRSPSREISL